MATERTPMRYLREIFRQKFVLSRSHREIAQSLGLSPSTVSVAGSRVMTAGLTWEAIESLTDSALEERLFGPKRPSRSERSLPDPARMHVELRRPGVTLQLLHLEYLEQEPTGVRYTTFCKVYRTWLRKQSPVMRQTHEGGGKLFVDYSGKKPHIVDPETGEVSEVELFVAVLGASNFTYAEATRTQQVSDFIGSHLRAFEAIGGVAHAIVPDQLKSGVSKACRYEPSIQRTYREMAKHYGTVILPARPRHPRDKAKVEVGVQIAQRWIVARLRNETFFSLSELNSRIRELCDELNRRRMRVYGASRKELLERVERPHLLPLSVDRFVPGEWKTVKVNIDYHIEFDHHYYSAPHGLLHEALEVRATASTIELYRNGERVASHARSFVRGKHTTVAQHMPKAHQKHLEWSPSRIANWAETIGPHVAALVQAILASRPHPEQGYRSCLGILRLAKRYRPERLEAACERAMSVGGKSYRHVESILKNGLDRMPLSAAQTDAFPIVHENVRGRTYYQ
jgi:transposase